MSVTFDDGAETVRGDDSSEDEQIESVTTSSATVAENLRFMGLALQANPGLLRTDPTPAGRDKGATIRLVLTRFDSSEETWFVDRNGVQSGGEDDSSAAMFTIRMSSAVFGQLASGEIKIMAASEHVRVEGASGARIYGDVLLQLAGRVNALVKAGAEQKLLATTPLRWDDCSSNVRFRGYGNAGPYLTAEKKSTFGYGAALGSPVMHAGSGVHTITFDISGSASNDGASMLVGVADGSLGTQALKPLPPVRELVRRWSRRSGIKTPRPAGNAHGDAGSAGSAGDAGDVGSEIAGQGQGQGQGQGGNETDDATAAAAAGAAVAWGVEPSSSRLWSNSR